MTSRSPTGGHRIIWTIADLYGEEVTLGFASPRGYVSLLATEVLYSDAVMPMNIYSGMTSPANDAI